MPHQIELAAIMQLELNQYKKIVVDVLKYLIVILHQLNDDPDVV